MSVNRKLTTNSSMAAWSMSLDVSCYVCQHGVDELDHIFRQCFQWTEDVINIPTVPTETQSEVG
ncbi:hypothetical protein LINGRAHAP2_LOCUS15947, partial [Linum grandiflorum]